jgi:hypothetical protein
LPDEDSADERKRKAVSLNPFEMSDDEDADLSVLDDNVNDSRENDFREMTASRETSSFYETIEDNDSKYYSANSNM